MQGNEIKIKQQEEIEKSKYVLQINAKEKTNEANLNQTEGTLNFTELLVDQF